MRSMPVIAVDPRGQLRESLCGVLVEPSVGPFADGGLDEAFGFAVGAWRVQTRADRFDMECAAVCREAAGAETGTVIGQNAAHGDSQVGEVGHRLTEKFACRPSSFVRQHGGEGDAGVIVDGHIKKFPAGAARFVLRISGEGGPVCGCARAF